MYKKTIPRSNFIWPACKEACLRLNPLLLKHNFIMFIVEIAAIIITILTIKRIWLEQSFTFELPISIWLWLSVLFSNFAESLAEIKGKFQAEALKQGRTDVYAKKISLGNIDAEDNYELIPALALRKGDTVSVSDGMIIPSDGEIIAGVALVDESAITGESAPVVREANSERTGVTGGTKVLSGTIKVEIKAEAGSTFIDQMISMIESTKRLKTPSEITLEIFLVISTILFAAMVITLYTIGGYLKFNIDITLFIALFICFIPTTIGGLLPAISISGMDRLLLHNVMALNGRAIEAAGDINVVLLDKTGTITLGNRSAIEFIAAPQVREKDLIRLAMLSSLADNTPEGRSIVILAKEKLHIRGRDIRPPIGSKFIEFDAATKISGINIQDLQIRKGALEAIEFFARTQKVKFPEGVKQVAIKIAREGGTPLVVADQHMIYGVIYLKDILKEDIRERLLKLRKMGLTSVMITGDNPLTAAAIGAEAGASDFIAQATPTLKLKRIRKYQQDGYIVAMIGDGTNDAPALAQADLAVAMNIGTQAAREAANMIDLDSNPTKLLDIIKIGKQILLTRGAITTFSIAGDIIKYFMIIPIFFAAACPFMNIFNITHLTTPYSAVLAAIIFNALSIPILTPLVLRGTQYQYASISNLLKKNLLHFGIGGILFTIIGIKIIDLFITRLGWL